METEYPGGWKPPYTDYEVTEKRYSGGGIGRLYIPKRTPEQEAAWLDGINRSVRQACPGWRLRRGGNATVDAL